MRTIPYLAFAVSILSIVLAGSAGAMSGKMTLISRDKPSPVIVIGADATASEQFAAEEMAAYLGKIAGKKIEVISDGSIPEGRVIAVGKNKLTESIDISSLDCEQYIIDVQPDKLIIIGGRREAKPGQTARDAGTLYGVYEFLENLGVRWYRPEPWGEHVPKMVEISLQIGKKVSSKPSYVMRCITATSYFREQTKEEAERAAIWTVRNRTNTHSLGPKFGGSEQYGWGHVFELMFPAAEYLKTHPEYFALVKGERVTYDLCLGNPELQRALAEKLIARAKENPYASSVPAEPRDCMGNICECELCKVLDEPKNPRQDGQGSNRLAAVNNIVAKMVAKEAPWAKVQWLGYSSHTAAPTNLRQLEPNTIIMLAPINQWNDWSKKLMDSSSPANAMFVQAARDWNALKPYCLMTYDYFEGYGWPGPIPVTRTVADRMKNYRKLGIRGMYFESVVSKGPQGLDFYMNTRLMWNPDMDVDEELNLYYKNYYGPAEKPMKAYHERFMKALAAAKYPVQSGGRGMHLILTPKLMKELGRYMSQAQALVKGQPLYERRLHGAWAGYEFSRRISEILVLKKKGILSARTGSGSDGAELPPDLQTAGANGQSYHESAEANKAYGDLVRWMRTVNVDDHVFDMALKFTEDAAESVFPKGGTNDVGACWLIYLPMDVLRNELTPYTPETVLLKDF